MQRITYRQLRELINQLHEDQLDADVTIETIDNNCFAATFAVTGADIIGWEDSGLENNHPVILELVGEANRTSAEELEEYIDRLKLSGGFGPVKDM